MLAFVAISTIILIVFGSVCMVFKKKVSPIISKNVLIIGGTSGLGRGFARYLYKLGNKVTITSRKLETAQKVAEEIKSSAISNLGEINCIAVDVTAEKPYGDSPSGNYDYIFCVPGFCVPKYFKDQSFENVFSQINLNYLSVIKCLQHYRESNGKPFTFIMIGSTASLFYFPGFSSYSPTKSALYAFTKAARMELKREGIELKIFLATGMRTRGFYEENKVKTKFTEYVETMNVVQEPEYAATYFINNIGTRNVITSDWFTYFNAIKVDCEKAVDYLLFPVALCVVAISKWFVGMRYKQFTRE